MNTQKQTTFLISIQWSSDKFIFQGAKELIKILKQAEPGKGIEFIKRFNPSTSKFEAISKDLIKKSFDYNTEAIEELKKINFIK